MHIIIGGTPEAPIILILNLLLRVLGTFVSSIYLDFH